MVFCNCSIFCFALLCIHSSFAIISIGKRELAAFSLFVFLVSHNCCVALPHDAMSCLQFVISVFPDHTHLLFWMLVIVTQAILHFFLRVTLLCFTLFGGITVSCLWFHQTTHVAFPDHTSCLRALTRVYINVGQWSSSNTTLG